MEIILGVDCGATSAKVGLFDQTGALLAKNKISSPLKSHPGQFAFLIKQEALNLQKDVPDQVIEIVKIGVGAPGPIDFEKGAILPSANLGNQEPIDLKNQFQREFSCQTMIERDTNLALLGEAWIGAAIGKKEVVMLTLGSGVGGAIMVNGQLEKGQSGQAGELGHMIISTSLMQGSCRSSAPQFSHCANKRGAPLRGAPTRVTPTSEKFAATPLGQLPVCGLGHQGCLEAMINSAHDLAELSYYLGLGLANIVDIFNPEMIIVGGGKVFSGDFLPEAVEIMNKNAMKTVLVTAVVYAKLGEWSGIYGAARLALGSLKK